jgi:hypothetical protein
MEFPEVRSALLEQIALLIRNDELPALLKRLSELRQQATEEERERNPDFA